MGTVLAPETAAPIGKDGRAVVAHFFMKVVSGSKQWVGAACCTVAPRIRNARVLVGGNETNGKT